MRQKDAFTLIELLVVIAIISILAAITFPVFARAKDGAYRSSDINNMNQLRTAIQLYKADQGAYPPALLGYVSLYQSGPNAGNVIPADQVQGALYPKRVQSIETFRPAYNRVGNNLTTTAVWPARWVNPAETDPLRLQRFGTSDTVQRAVFNGTCSEVNAQYYAVSGYDVARVPDGAGGFRYELRYALFWSGYGVPTSPCATDGSGLGSPTDDPRQLGYTDPPDTSVVTWNSYYRDYSNGAVTRTKRDIVLFVGGSARAYDSASVAERSWQVAP
jgi:prepilin-type N-terminal cleavage/methylation domain-containing protein